jgi:hypothetical protein
MWTVSIYDKDLFYIYEIHPDIDNVILTFFFVILSGFDNVRFSKFPKICPDLAMTFRENVRGPSGRREKQATLRL